MRRQPWTASSRRLALLFCAVALPPAATLVWLGLQFLDEDRAMLAQRELEQRQADADAIVRSLNLSLTLTERALSEPAVPGGMVRFVIGPEQIRAEPADRVAWLPRVPQLAAEDPSHFAHAEQMEYEGGANRALAMYEDAARSAVPEVRAGGLLRVARIQRSRQNWDGAASAYRRLAGIRAVAIEGTPADLQARRGLCEVLAEAQRAPELLRETKGLEADLLAGKWVLDYAAWQLTTRDIARWSGHPMVIPEERRLFSDIADSLWRERSGPLQGRRLINVGNDSVTVLTRRLDGRDVALALAPSTLNAWVETAIRQAHEAGVRLTLLTPNGRVVSGSPSDAQWPSVKALTSDTGLPWTVFVQNTGASSVVADVARRRRQLATGLAAILLLFVGSSYFLWRAMQRDLAIARLQADFVSAVSHEFRTPLTSLRHVTELLQETDDVPLDRRRRFYEVLDRNTERLYRLVESLLDFSRMESGRKPYDLRPIEVDAFAADVVGEFQKEAAGRGFTVNLIIDPQIPRRVQADRASLANALWNLLDNAVKYSVDSRKVDVHVEPAPSGVAIAVRDRGLGIPPHERKEIFRRFVRGEKVSHLGIKGTGLGLAMVAHIVEAHGGRIEVDSEEGVGSTFRMVLPAPS
jgi:signal transduction histidine kinase